MARRITLALCSLTTAFQTPPLRPRTRLRAATTTVALRCLAQAVAPHHECAPPLLVTAVFARRRPHRPRRQCGKAHDVYPSLSASGPDYLTIGVYMCVPGAGACPHRRVGAGIWHRFGKTNSASSQIDPVQAPERTSPVQIGDHYLNDTRHPPPCLLPRSRSIVTPPPV